MNLIEKIAAYIKAEYTSAEAAVKLAADHGVEVTEDWIDKIRSADGFTHVLDSVEGHIDAAVHEAAGAVNNVGDAAGPAVETDAGAAPKAPSGTDTATGA